MAETEIFVGNFQTKLNENKKCKWSFMHDVRKCHHNHSLI